jgi:hypothetical protein
VFKITRNEVNPRKNNKALNYYLKTLTKNNTPPTLSHGKGKWGKGLRTRINEVITTKQLVEKNPTNPLYLRGWVKQLIIINKV